MQSRPSEGRDTRSVSETCAPAFAGLAGQAVCVFDGHGVDGHWPAWRVTETIPHFLQEERPLESKIGGWGNTAGVRGWQVAADMMGLCVEMFGKRYFIWNIYTWSVSIANSSPIMWLQGS